MVVPARPAHIAIVGGGFTGAAVALNLLRDLPADAASITIVEPRATLGAGLAYSTTDPAHRTNVAAMRLLVLPEAPGAFDGWLRTSGALDGDPAALLDDGRAYPQRGVFGRYVDDLLRRAAANADAAPFSHIRAKAECVERSGRGYSLRLDNGVAIAADIIVLAVSHPPPGVPGPLRAVAGLPKFIADPWNRDIKAVLAKRDRVLVIGTALTAADIISTLHQNGHEGEIVAVSRRGLVSRRREVPPAEPFGDFKTNPSRTCVSLLREVRRTIGEAVRASRCWEPVMDALRAQGFEIWAALPDAEKARFLRHLRPFWDAHRYQLAPQPAATLNERRRAGGLRFLAARILRAAEDGGGFAVTLRGTREPAERVERFDAIVNCTGPDHAGVTLSNPVLASLAQAGALKADPFGLGVLTDATARAVGADGRPRPDIFVAGPLARAAFGELMGLPQVTLHAALVAKEIAASVAAARRRPRKPNRKAAPAASADPPPRQARHATRSTEVWT